MNPVTNKSIVVFEKSPSRDHKTGASLRGKGGGNEQKHKVEESPVHSFV